MAPASQIDLSGDDETEFRWTHSVKFTTANKSGASGSGPWAKRLPGARYIRFSTKSDYSEKEYYDFCSNGRFFHKLDVSSSGPLGTGGMNDDAGGKWTVSGDTLTLVFDSGSMSTVNLVEKGGALYVGGQKWFRKASPRCR